MNPSGPPYCVRPHNAVSTLLSRPTCGVPSFAERVASESTVELPAPSSGGPLRIFVPRTFLDSKVTGRGWRWERNKAPEASEVRPQTLRINSSRMR